MSVYSLLIATATLGIYNWCSTADLEFGIHVPHGINYQ